MAASKFIILALGAGYTGHIILGKTQLSDLITSIQEALSKVSKEKNNSGQNVDNAALQAQIWRLTQEMKQLYGAGQITVVNGSASRDSIWPSLIVPAAVVGATGYCYMWWKGWRFGDLMYVTKRNMTNIVASFSKQLEHVSEALAVVEVREDLAKMGIDIEAVQNIVQGLEYKIDSIDEKQEITNAGVVYLCRFVQGLAVGGQRPELLQSFSPKPRLERSASLFGGDSGLKGLQYITDALAGTKGAKSAENNMGTEEITARIITPGQAL